MKMNYEYHHIDRLSAVTFTYMSTQTTLVENRKMKDGSIVTLNTLYHYTIYPFRNVSKFFKTKLRIYALSDNIPLTDLTNFFFIILLHSSS